MKILSWNVNGLRAVYQRNFLEIIDRLSPDIICLQEIKASPQQLPPELQQLSNHFCYFNSAQKKGYSGVAIYSKEKPLSIRNDFGLERFDQEGRFLQLEFSNFILIP